MLFKPRFVAPILAGAKTVTRRPPARRYLVGSVHQFYARPPWCHGEPFARARVVSVNLEPLSAMTPKEARLEGFNSLAEFWDELRAIYPDASEGTTVQRVAFELVEE